MGRLCTIWCRFLWWLILGRASPFRIYISGKNTFPNSIYLKYRPDIRHYCFLLPSYLLIIATYLHFYLQSGFSRFAAGGALFREIKLIPISLIIRFRTLSRQNKPGVANSDSFPPHKLQFSVIVELRCHVSKKTTLRKISQNTAVTF